MSMVRRSFVVFALFVLTACGAPNLSEVKLEPLLVQDGDLPVGVDTGQVRDTAPQMFDSAPKPTKAAYEQLARNGQQIGGVTVLLYDDAARVKQAYDAVAGGMTKDSTDYSGVGESAKLLQTQFTALGMTLSTNEILWQRCNAVAHVRVVGVLDKESLVGYAKRLDTRLQQAVCS